jgi:hypothetical protein
MSISMFTQKVKQNSGAANMFATSAKVFSVPLHWAKQIFVPKQK